MQKKPKSTQARPVPKIELALLSSDSPVLLEGDSAWKTVADFPELRQLPKSLATQGPFFRDCLSDERLKLPSLSCQHSYAKALGCPFEPDQIDRHQLAHIIRSLSSHRIISAGSTKLGRACRRDLGKAAALYQKAADQGHAAEQNNLGLLYQHGEGVPKDLGKAAELYQKAADQGNADAQYNLGWLYEYGRGVPTDSGKAKELLEKAAKQGDQRAIRWLKTLSESPKND
jgi:hypothetical protein